MAIFKKRPTRKAEEKQRAEQERQARLARQQEAWNEREEQRKNRTLSQGLSAPA